MKRVYLDRTGLDHADKHVILTKAKHLLCVLAMLALSFSLAALAESGIALDEDKVLSGMERSWAQGYGPTVADGAVSIHLPLRSDRAVGKLKATLSLEDPAVTPFRSQDMSVSSSRSEDRVFPIKFRLRLLTDYQNGDYPCRVHVEGRDGSGEPLSMDLPMLLRIRGGRDGYGELRLEIVDVQSELNAGEAGKLSLRVVNPYPNVEMRDVLMSVSEEGNGEKTEVMCEGSGTIALGTLAPGGETSLEVPLKALPSASVGLHTLKVRLTYTALDGTRTWEQSFNLPVSQEIRLEQGGVQMASSIIQGDTASLILPLMNMGRGELRNVYASLTMPGVVEQQSVLVGTLPSGESKQAKISWSVAKATEPGDYTGTLRVSGEDAWGNSTAFELPVPLTVEARVIEEETDAKDTILRTVGDNRLTYVLAGLCALLVVALIAQGAVMRGRLRKAEEDRL